MPYNLSRGTVYAKNSPVPRELRDRFAEVINVKDFGARGDGDADDTAALAAAIAAAGTGGTVFIPPGTYRHTGITINQSIILRGSGWMATVLKNVSVSAPAVTVSRQPGSGTAPDGYIVGGVLIEQLQLTGTSTGAAVLYNTQSHTVLRDVYILSNGGHGVQLSTDSHVYGLTIDHCVIQGNVLDGIYGRGEGLRQINAVQIVNGTELVANRNGINLWGINIGIVGSIIEGNRAAGIYLNADDMVTTDASADAYEITGNYFEANKDGAIVGLTAYAGGGTTVHYAMDARISGNFIVQSTSQSNPGTTAAISLAGAYGSYKGAVIGPNTYRVDGTIGYVDLHAVHNGTTTLVPALRDLMPFATGYKNVDGVTMTADRTDTVNVPYGPTMTFDAAAGVCFIISATDGLPMTIAAPTNPWLGRRITVQLANVSGGALGAVTWAAAYKLATWVNPASGFRRSIDFQYNSGKWVEVSRTPDDVPN